ncbi:MAG: sugar isomerase domain-containing protein [Armatimonadota bacterium]
MLIDRYFDAIIAKLQELRREESAGIAKAAEACAKALASGGVIHIHDTGHMVSTELVHRAGGLAAISPFGFSLNVNNPNAHRDRRRGQPPSGDPELVSLALRRSNVRSGDVMVIGSVSGKSAQVVELALQARAMGVTTIGLTAVAYSSKLASDHPSGKRLFESVDIVLDNHADYGDAMLEVEGMDRRICPASGICAAAALWALTAGIVERMVAIGKPPAVYRSVNLPGGPDDVKATQDLYAERGF